jgi:flagellar L-ring protein precursor FlgH
MKALSLILIACLGCGATAQSTGSLWSDATGAVIRDLKAREVGDVLTVIITETSSASSKADTSTKKDDELSTTAGIGPILSSILPELSGSTSMESSGSGSTTRSGSLSARMTVVVKEVLPNGNLFVEGKRDVLVNKETQKLVLTGIVRPADISSGNTVPSYLVADAEIYYEGKGPIAGKQREGLIVRLFNAVFGGLF